MDESTNTAQVKKGSTMPVILVVVLLVVLGGFAFFASQNKSSPAQPATQSQNEMTTPTAAMDGKETPAAGDAMEESGTTKEFTIVGSPFKFEPAEIRVKKGDTVKITFQSKQGVHDWVLDEFNMRTKQIPAGQTETVEFVANKAGTFEYYCSVGNHRQMGMKGNLIVE